MSTGRYRATINGFWCRNETWDDALERDGKRDEIYFSVNTKYVGRDGTIKHDFTGESAVMGDTLRQNGRVRAGSASEFGGIRTGDMFPSNTPMIRTNPLEVGRRYPPYTIWEGDLTEGGDLVMLLPTICEHDDGPDFFQSWLQWQVGVDATYGQRAKEIFTGIWPLAGPVFDAVSLGLKTLDTLNGMWGLFGTPGRRPIGLQRDPANPNGVKFNPTTIALSAETVDEFITQDLTGVGPGLLELTYADDPHLKGVYSFYVQIEKVAGPAGDWADGSVLREVARPEVFVVFGNAKFHVPDEPTLARLYGGWTAVHVVADGTLARVDGVPDDGTLLREENNASVWRIEGGRKRHVTSPAVLARFGGWAGVRVVPDSALAALPVGAPIQ
jgi:hypothetical protein